MSVYIVGFRESNKLQNSNFWVEQEARIKYYWVLFAHLVAMDATKVYKQSL